VYSLYGRRKLLNKKYGEGIGKHEEKKIEE
jgi:hypothetical protein